MAFAEFSSVALADN